MRQFFLFLCLFGISQISHAQSEQDDVTVLSECYKIIQMRHNSFGSDSMYIMDYNVDFPKALKAANSQIQFKTRGELKALNQKEFFVFKDFTVTGSKAVLNFSYYSANPEAAITSYHMILEKKEGMWLITDHQVN